MRTLSLVLFACGLISTASAAIVVNPAQPITKQVTVQLVQTALDNGTSPATVFGTSAQRASIEAAMDKIWSQAGIDINVLPSVTRYNDTFAYRGNAGSGVRPGGDIATIYSNARSEGGILHPSSSLVLHIVFANIVPGFPWMGEGVVAGIATVDGGGIVGFVGDNLLTSQSGRDDIASVMAHEIGHNLGLSHTSQGGQANLMSSGGTSEQLTASQIANVRDSKFARAYSPPVPGDYNSDGIVSAKDYVVWRMTPSQSGTYDTWSVNYGDSNVAGTTNLVSSTATTQGAVPEPSAVLLAILASCATFGMRRRHSSRRWLATQRVAAGAVAWVLLAPTGLLAALRSWVRKHPRYGLQRSWVQKHPRYGLQRS